MNGAGGVGHSPPVRARHPRRSVPLVPRSRRERLLAPRPARRSASIPATAHSSAPAASGPADAHAGRRASGPTNARRRAGRPSAQESSPSASRHSQIPSGSLGRHEPGHGSSRGPAAAWSPWRPRTCRQVDQRPRDAPAIPEGPPGRGSPALAPCTRGRWPEPPRPARACPRLFSESALTGGCRRPARRRRAPPG